MSGYSAILPILKKISTSYGDLTPNVRKGIQGTIGTGVGAATGDYLNEDETDSSSTFGGALLGGALGAASGHTNYRQMAPITEWMQKQFPQMMAKGDPMPSPISTWDRGVAATSDRFTPWKNLLGMEEKTNASWDSTFGGAGGFADALMAEPGRHVEALRAPGLQHQLREFLALNASRRHWENLQRRQAETMEEARMHLVRGDTKGANAARDAYLELQQRLDEHKVAYDDASVAKLKGYQTQFETELGPERYGQITTAADSIFDAHSDLRKRAFDSGIIDQKTFDRFESESEAVPFSPGYRNLLQQGPDGQYYAAPQTRTKLQRTGMSQRNADDVIQQLEGSTRVMDDPLAGSFFHMQETAKAVQRNDHAKLVIGNAMEVADEAGNIPGSGFYIRKMEPGETLQPGEGTVAYMAGGQKQAFAVPVEFADIMDLAELQDVASGFQIMSGMQRWVSRLITSANIAFQIPNAFKDVTGAVLMTPVWRDPGKFGKAWLSAMRDIYKEDFRNAPQSLDRKNFRLSGAANSGLSRNLQEAPSWQGIVGNDDLSALGEMGKIFQDILNITEESTKMATFKTLKNQQARGSGKADWQIKDLVRRKGGSPDYSRKGNLSRQVGALYQFFNPTVQGLTRFYEAGAKDPAWLIKTMGVLSMGMLTLNKLNQTEVNPETGRPLFEEIDPQERRSNIIFMLGGTEVTSQGRSRPRYVKLPLSHEAKALLTPMMDLLQNANQEPEAPGLAQGAANAVSNLLPISGTIDSKNLTTSLATNLVSSMNPILREPVEQLADMSAFNGVPIVGRRLGRLDPSEQFTDTTSPLMTQIAHAPGIRNIPWANSPQRLEHMYRAFFPGAAEIPLSLIDARRPKVAQGQQEWGTKLPGVGPILRRFLPSGQDHRRDAPAEAVYGRFDDAERATATFNNELDPVKKAAYLEEKRPLLLQHKALSPIIRALGELGKERRAIVADQSLSPAERQAQMKRVYDRQLSLLKMGQDKIISLDSAGEAR